MKSITVIFILFSITLQAYNLPNLVQKMKTEQKVALIIGNNTYTNLTHLKNTVNDARLMRDTFKQGGYTIIYKENATKNEMKKLLKKFAHKISKGGIGLYYFAGHSVNVNGKNYLLGIDSSLDNKDYIERESVVINNIIKKMNNARNRLNIIISDTCRNTIRLNTFHNNHYDRGVGKGLTSISNTRKIFLVYSTATGEIARDTKNGSHGILTDYFVKNLKKGTSIKEIFENTKKDVYKHIEGDESTDIRNQMMRDFFFILPD